MPVDQTSIIVADRVGVTAFHLAKTITKNSVAELIGTSVAMGSSLVAVPLLARYLGAADYGKYSVAVAFTTLFISASDLGLGNIATRDVAADKSKASKYFGNILVIRGILGIFLPFLISAIALALPYQNDTKTAICILALGNSMAGLSRAYTWLFQAFQRLEYDALFTILGSLVNLGVVIIIIAEKGDFITLVIGISIVNLMTFVLGLIIALVRFVKPRFELDLDFARYLFKECLPLTATWAFATVYVWIGLPLLSLMSGDTAAGWYSGANKIAVILRMLPTLFVPALFPVLAETFQSRERFLSIAQRSFEMFLAIGLALTIGITVFSERVVLLILGSQYLPSSPVLIAIVWAFLFVCISQLGGAILITAGRQRVNAFATGLGLAAHLFLNFVLIPRYAEMGLALSVLATEGLVAFVVMVYLGMEGIFRFRPRQTIGLIAGSLAMGAGMFVFQDSTLLGAVSGIVFFVCILVLSNVISVRDLRLVSHGAFGRDVFGIGKEIE